MQLPGEGPAGLSLRIDGRKQRGMHAIGQTPRPQRRDDVVRERQAGKHRKFDGVGTMALPAAIEPPHCIVVDRDFGGVGDELHVLRAGRVGKRLVEQTERAMRYECAIAWVA